ncbi:MAG: purine-nucleoside phosphorylase, partial [Epsilonproteobacteria bacterium]|nr:purine-nucleoside phosphorylase [Campylobacterota bacterium]
MIVCAGRSETFDFAIPVGVGLIESAINLTRLCLFD